MGKEINPKLLDELRKRNICEICQGTVEVKTENGRIVVTSPDCKSHRTKCLRAQVEEKLSLW